MTRRDTLVGGLLATGLMLLLAHFASWGVDQHHDGVMLKPALDVLSGQVLFRDTFMQYGALTCYLQVLALWIQPSLLSVRLLTLAAYAVTLFFLYASWRLILPRSLALFSSGLFVLFVPAYEKNWINQYWVFLPWSSVFALMFQSLGLFALFRVIRGEQPVRWGLVLGAACACVLWCRQSVGLIMLGCLVVIWLALHWTNWAPPGPARRSILVAIIGGFVAVNAPLLGGIALSGAVPEWWYQNFVWPRKWVLENPPMNLRDSLSFLVHPAASARLLVLLVAAAFPGLIRRFRPDLPARLILACYLGLGVVFAWQHEWLFKVLDLREGGWTILLPFLVLLQLAVSFTRAFSSRGAPKTTEYYSIAALAVLSLGSLLQYYPVPDSWHILWSLAPAFGLITYVLWRWLDWPPSVVVLVFSAAFLPSVYAKAQSIARALSEPMVTLTEPSALRGMKVSPAQARRLGLIVSSLAPILRHRPDLPSALIGNDAMYLCFTNNRTNPSPYFVTWKNLAENEDNRKRWDHILRLRPLIFLQNARWEAVGDFYQRARYVPLLDIPEEALEIAVPQELADALGFTTSGASAQAGRARPQ